MLNPDSYAPFFEVISHINFAGVALLTLFYDKIHRHLVSEFEDTAVDVEFAKERLTEIHGSKVNKENAEENFKNAKKWRNSKRKLSILSPFIKVANNKLHQINSEEGYVLKYLPFFLYSGLFCIAMLALAGFHKENENLPSIHQCNVYLIRLLVTSAAIILTTMFFLFKIRKLGRLIFTHFFLIVLWMLITYFFLESVNVVWLHFEFHKHELFIERLIFFIAILPIPYIVFKTVMLFGMIKLVKVSNPLSQELGNMDMDRKIFKDQRFPKKQIE